MLIIIILLLSPACALIGYDCGGSHLNVSTFSLLKTGDCNLGTQHPKPTDVYIQLLQLSHYKTAEVIQCKVEIHRTVYHCGMHSHLSVVFNGYAEYLHEIEYTICLRMQQDGVFNLGNGIYLKELKPNQTSTRPVTLHGTIGNDGSCQGSQYSDHYGTWDAAVVQGIIRITLKSGIMPVHLESNKIILKSGIVCTFTDGYCTDPENGYTYWKPFPTLSCKFDQHDVLYEGPATKITDRTYPGTPIIFSLTTQDITFSLMQTGEEILCGYTLIKTEHPKLFVLEIEKGKVFTEKGSMPVNHMNLFSYINSKFVYVERHLKTQMTTLYQDVLRQKCNLEKKVLQNTLGFATILPDEFAYRLMKGPGFMATIAGEIIHVIKCIPVDVIIRKTSNCFNELPVSPLNVSYFLTPKSRILTKIEAERECNTLLPVAYQIEGTWVRFNPTPEKIIVPPELQPMTSPTWKYLTPKHLATSGNYTSKDLDNLRDFIMFPAEKPALLNTLARGAGGRPIQSGTLSMYNLLDKDSLNKILNDTVSRVWEGFITFGSATAGLFGVFFIIRIIKVIIDTFIHGYALHSIYGCSFHLIGALWSSITHLLLHLAQQPVVALVVLSD